MVVLDASALLAYLLAEPGAEDVGGVLREALLSAVNLAEVYSQFDRRGADVTGLADQLADAGLVLVPFSVDDAEEAGRLFSVTRAAGLSLGDRAWLALARRQACPAWTTDRAWQGLSVGVDIHVIR